MLMKLISTQQNKLFIFKGLKMAQSKRSWKPMRSKRSGIKTMKTINKNLEILKKLK